MSKALTKKYTALLSGITGLLEDARRYTAKTVNSIMTATYWEVGRRIVESEQKGKNRAEYGQRLLENLAKDLTTRFGKGFSRQNLQQMRIFFLAYPIEQIRQTVSGKFQTLSEKFPAEGILISQTLSGKSGNKGSPSLSFHELSQVFPLSWSHYVLLISLKNRTARSFYESEALRGGWSVRQLSRQIDSQFYERTALSRNKAVMLTKGSRKKPEDELTPEEEIKQPYVLEFLGLKDEYSESDLEEALIRHLEYFLLELGGDFAFMARQKRLRIDDEWYRVDLLFFHRRLKCLILIDLKIGKFTHADAGQMHMYLNYAQEHWKNTDENPPVGLILCARKSENVVKYALDNLPNKVMAAEYRTVLPKENEIAEELRKTQRMLETRNVTRKIKKK